MFSIMRSKIANIFLFVQIERWSQLVTWTIEQTKTNLYHHFLILIHSNVPFVLSVKFHFKKQHQYYLLFLLSTFVKKQSAFEKFKNNRIKSFHFSYTSSNNHKNYRLLIVLAELTIPKKLERSKNNNKNTMWSIVQ